MYAFIVTSTYSSEAAPPDWLMLLMNILFRKIRRSRAGRFFTKGQRTFGPGCANCPLFAAVRVQDAGELFFKIHLLGPSLFMNRFQIDDDSSPTAVGSGFVCPEWRINLIRIFGLA